MDTESEASLVLGIDDNEDYSNLIRRVLAIGGHKFLSAQSGEKGLEIFGSKRPDLVLLDFELPDMSGAECLKRMKADASDARSRIVVFSGHDTDVIADHFTENKPDDFLQKPADLSKLAELLENNIKLSKNRN